MDICERILAILDGTHEGDYPLNNKIGLGRNSILRWRQGQSKPSLDACMKIADYFGMSLDELVGRAEPSNANQGPLDPETRELLDGWRKLSKTQKQRILGQIQGLQGLPEQSPIAQALDEGEAIGRARAHARRQNETATDSKLA